MTQPRPTKPRPTKPSDVLVAYPDFTSFKRKSTSSLRALSDFFYLTEELIRQVPVPALRDQGRVFFKTLPNNVGSTRDALESLVAEMRIPVSVGSSEASRRTALEKGARGPKGWSYLAYTAEVDAMLRRRGRTLSEELMAPTPFRFLDARDLADVLWPPPPRSPTSAPDALAQFAQSEARWAAGMWAVLTDLHGSASGFEYVHDNQTFRHEGLKSDLRPAISAYTEGRASVDKLLQSAFAIRSRHNRLFDRYFQVVTDKFPTLVRAAGDGLVGLVENPEELASYFATAHKSTNGRLLSGLVVSRSTRIVDETYGRLDEGMAELKRDRSSALGTGVSVLIV